MRNSILSVLCVALLGVGMAHAQASQTSQPVLAPVAVEQFYHKTSDRTVWVKDSQYDGLIAALQGLEAHGLNPEHYHLSRLIASKGDTVARDRLATDAWFAAAAHMLYGKLDPVSVEPNWTAAGRQADLALVLKQALASDRIAMSLEQFAPMQSEYQTLVTEYARLKTLAATPITPIAKGDVLKPGKADARVTALQTRLVELGLLEAAGITGTMDEATDLAVKVFQGGVGLDEDGVVGAASLAALNRGPQIQLDQVRVNLERWRWLPADLGRRHLRANIADFNVTAWQDRILQRTHLTIVGKRFRKTPVFSDEIEYAIFNPWWETPNSLARLDKLPTFQRDPGAVERLGFQVLDRSGAPVNASMINWNEVSAANFPYRLRQKPGDQNALGQVKIMFPNQHNVYLHDTPTRGLFAQRQRAFSSGCLRTQAPIDLTAWLLEETPEWTRERIDAAVTSGTETRANLASKVPVHILYFTAVSEQDGYVRYLDDIYERDAAVLTGLRAQPR